MNLVNLIKDQLGGSVVSQIGGLLGESGGNTDRAVSGAIPAILGGLMNTAGDNDGAARLNRALDDQDDSILDNLGGLLGGGGHSQVASQGSSILGSLLGGNMLGSLAGAIGNFAGVGRGSSTSLIGMLVPIVLSVIRRQRNSQGLDAGGLASMLAGQRDNIAAAMPSGLSDHLSKEGLGDSLLGALSGGADRVSGAVNAAGDTVADAGRATMNAAGAAGGAAVAGAGAAAASGGGLLKKLIPLILLLVAAWIIWKFVFSDGMDAAVDKVAETGASVTETAKGMVGGDVGGQLGGIFENATSTFTGITDVESAKAAIPAVEGMTEKLGGLSSMFSSLPDDAKGQVTSLIGDKGPVLQGVIEKAMALPGVGDVLKPAADGLMAKLAAFGG